MKAPAQFSLRLLVLPALMLLLTTRLEAAASNCLAPPTGLVGWWSGDGHANDIAGTNHGTLVNGTAFADGYVGRAFSFDGVDDGVNATTPTLTNIQNDFTIEFWARPNRARALTPEDNTSVTGMSGQRYAIAPEWGAGTFGWLWSTPPPASFSSSLAQTFNLL
jgi:CubicO group peptidase (beta-lactamase class C family)